jgi:hypothetical protein
VWLCDRPCASALPPASPIPHRETPSSCNSNWDATSSEALKPKLIVGGLKGTANWCLIPPRDDVMHTTLVHVMCVTQDCREHGVGEKQCGVQRRKPFSSSGRHHTVMREPIHFHKVFRPCLAGYTSVKESQQDHSLAWALTCNYHRHPGILQLRKSSPTNRCWLCSSAMPNSAAPLSPIFNPFSHSRRRDRGLICRSAQISSQPGQHHAWNALNVCDHLCCGHDTSASCWCS